MRLWTPEQRAVAVNAAIGTVVVTAAAALTVWAMAALIIGSVALARWLGGTL
jgi:hypothetical protein